MEKDKIDTLQQIGDDTKKQVKGFLEGVKSLQELYSQNNKLLNFKEESLREKYDRIRILEAKLAEYYKSKVAFNDINEEASINYVNLKNMSNYKKIDSITVFEVKWRSDVEDKTIKEQKCLYRWLKKRLNIDTLKVVNLS